MRGCVVSRREKWRREPIVNFVEPLYLSIYSLTSGSAATNDTSSQLHSSSSAPPGPVQGPSSIGWDRIFLQSQAPQPQQTLAQSQPSRGIQERETVIQYAPATKRRKHEAYDPIPLLPRAESQSLTSLREFGNSELPYHCYRSANGYSRASSSKDPQGSVGQDWIACDDHVTSKHLSSWVEDSRRTSTHPEGNIMMAQSQSQNHTGIDASQPRDLTIRQPRAPVPSYIESYPQGISSNPRETQQSSQHLDTEIRDVTGMEEHISILQHKSRQPNGVEKLNFIASCLSARTNDFSLLTKWPAESLKMPAAFKERRYVISFCEMITRALDLKQALSFGERADSAALKDACKKMCSFKDIEERSLERQASRTLELSFQGHRLEAETLFGNLKAAYWRASQQDKSDKEHFSNAVTRACMSAALLCTLIRLRAPDFFSELISDPDLLWKLHLKMTGGSPIENDAENAWKEDGIYLYFACALLVAVQRAVSPGYPWLKNAYKVIRGKDESCVQFNLSDMSNLNYIIMVFRAILQSARELCNE